MTRSKGWNHHPCHHYWRQPVIFMPFFVHFPRSPPSGTSTKHQEWSYQLSCADHIPWSAIIKSLFWMTCWTTQWSTPVSLLIIGETMGKRINMSSKVKDLFSLRHCYVLKVAQETIVVSRSPGNMLSKWCRGAAQPTDIEPNSLWPSRLSIERFCWNDAINSTMHCLLRKGGRRLGCYENKNYFEKEWFWSSDRLLSWALSKPNDTRAQLAWASWVRSRNQNDIG